MKCLKRLTAVLLTAIMSAVSVGNMISASAEDADISEDAIYVKRYCFYVNENTYIAKFNANVSYNPNLITKVIGRNGDIGGEFKVNDCDIKSIYPIYPDWLSGFEFI